MKYLNAAGILPEHLLKERFCIFQRPPQKKNGEPLMVHGHSIKRETKKFKDSFN